MYELIFAIVLLIILTNIAWNIIINIDSKEKITTNTFGKYKIYHAEYGAEKYYFAKIIVCYILWVIPVYRRYRIVESTENGLQITIFKSLVEQELIDILETSYKNYNKKLIIKRVK